MSMAVIRALLGLACGAHLVLWVCDRRLTCLEGGRFAFPDLQNNTRLSAVLGETPPARPMGASLWGVFAMAAAFPGYLALAEWMRSFSAIAAGLMLAGSILFLLPGVAHHVFCGTVEWFYLRLGKTEEARAAIVEFFRKSAVTMAVCYAGLLLFAVSFFLAVAAGATSLPRWACLCNTLPLFLAAATFRIVGTGNLVNAGMFLGLIFLL